MYPPEIWQVGDGMPERIKLNQPWVKPDGDPLPCRWYADKLDLGNVCLR